MKSGIYGLFHLDGAPLAPVDLSRMGLTGCGAQSIGAAAAGVDRCASDSTHVELADGDLCILQGWLDEPEDLAAEMGLARDTLPATLARTAIERFGKDAPARMIGEWSCAIWRAASRQLTLVNAAAPRDPLYYAVARGRIAIAPDVWRLAGLDWIDGGLDEEGLLFRLGRHRVRRVSGDRTVLRGVNVVAPATTVTLALGSCRVDAARPFEPVPHWRGTFEEAMEEAGTLIGRIIRQRLARTCKASFLLSGGLDSTLLSCFGAAERRPEQGILLLTSAAPPNSGLAEETAFAQIVGDHIGLPIERVFPPADLSAYRPSTRQLEAADGPVLSPRTYLYEAFFNATLRFGASVIFDGGYGELTVSEYARRLTLRSLARQARAWLRELTTQSEDRRWPTAGFHVQLAPRLSRALPPALADAWQRPFESGAMRRVGDKPGYAPSVEKSAAISTEALNGQMRFEFVFRDVRVLRFFAGLPTAFMEHGGLDRAPARAILAGKIPDSIRLRPKGPGISPDYFQRLQAQAPAARARIPMYEAAGVADWLDIEWLDAALRRMGQSGPVGTDDAFKIQLTAQAAEFVLWRKAASRGG